MSYTDSKIYLGDYLPGFDDKKASTGFILAKDDQQAIFGTDGDIGIEFDSGNSRLKIGGDIKFTGHNPGQILISNAMQAVDTEWSVASNGTLQLAASQTSKKAVVHIPGLKVGDEITGFKVLGQVESGGNTVTLDADLRKILAAASDPTDSSIGAIDQQSLSSDTKLDVEKSVSAETVAADTGYYVLVTATTTASTDVQLIGVEVDVNRK